MPGLASQQISTVCQTPMQRTRRSMHARWMQQQQKQMLLAAVSDSSSGLAL
jgi:hypothetical protein